MFYIMRALCKHTNTTETKVSQSNTNPLLQVSCSVSSSLYSPSSFFFSFFSAGYPLRWFHDSQRGNDLEFERQWSRPGLQTQMLQVVGQVTWTDGRAVWEPWEMERTWPLGKSQWLLGSNPALPFEHRSLFLDFVIVQRRPNTQILLWSFPIQKCCKEFL